MNKYCLIAVVAVCTGLSGCGSLLQRTFPAADESVSAAAIDPATDELNDKLKEVTKQQNRAFGATDAEKIARAQDWAEAMKARAIAAKAKADAAAAEATSASAAATVKKSNTKSARSRAATAAKLAERRQAAADLAQANADASKARVSAERSDLKRAKLEYLAAVVFQSEKKCNDFMNRVVLGQNTVDTTADILATTLSALSTAFTPVATKTALSAGATIASGTKANIDADIYAKAAISDFATAISQSYYSNIQTYTSNLPKLTDNDDAPLVLTNEVSKIESYHATCSLASAESTIKASLAKAAATPAPAQNPSTPQTPSTPAAGEASPAATESAVAPASSAQAPTVSSTGAVPGAALAAPPPPVPVPQ